MKLFFLLLGYVTSTSDLQPSTAIANQLPLASSHRGKYIVALIVLCPA